MKRGAPVVATAASFLEDEANMAKEGGDDTL